MSKAWCGGGRHFSENINHNLHEKLNPGTKTLVKNIEAEFSNCGRSKSQIFTISKSQEGKIAQKKENVNTGLNKQCRIQHGVIQIAREILQNCMICVLIVIVTPSNKVCLLLNKYHLMSFELKVNLKTFLLVRRMHWENFRNQLLVNVAAPFNGAKGKIAGVI